MTALAATSSSASTDLFIYGRAPSTPFPLPDLVAAYDLGVWRSLRWLPRGKNEHAQVTTDHTRFFLRRSHRRKTFESLVSQVEFLRRLRRDGLPVPVPLPARGGNTIVTAQGRLFLASDHLPGLPYDTADLPEQVRAAGRALATYHATVASYPLPTADLSRDDSLEGLRELCAAVRPGDFPDLHAAADEFIAALDPLWADLPVTTVHGGFRRGSLLFDGSSVTGMLDIDSARSGPRCLDLAIALHDFGKVYTSPEADDHKVAMDLDRTAEFLRGYRDVSSLTDVETEAVPLLIASRHAKRALAKAQRTLTDDDISAKDLTKLEHERHRVAWLRENRDRIHRVCRAA